MIYITQLIYIIKGKEDIFEQFEQAAIPVISKYEGRLLLRTRPQSVAEAHFETPYEIHLVSFPSDTHFEQFTQDEGRKAFLHLKEASVRAVVLIKGARI